MNHPHSVMDHVLCLQRKADRVRVKERREIETRLGGKVYHGDVSLDIMLVAKDGAHARAKVQAVVKHIRDLSLYDVKVKLKGVYRSPSGW